MSVITMWMRAVRWHEAVSAQANSRSEVKRSGRSQNSTITEMRDSVQLVSAQANSRSELCRSQNPNISDAAMVVVAQAPRLHLKALSRYLVAALNTNPLCLCVSVVNRFLSVLNRLIVGACPTASFFLLIGQKKETKEKTTLRHLPPLGLAHRQGGCATRPSKPHKTWLAAELKQVLAADLSPAQAKGVAKGFIGALNLHTLKEAHLNPLSLCVSVVNGFLGLKCNAVSDGFASQKGLPA